MLLNGLLRLIAIGALLKVITFLVFLEVQLENACVSAARGASTAPKDLYAILGVSKTAKMKDIKAAYRLKAKETHPDKNPEKDEALANEEFRLVAHAYEVLSDEKARRTYDQTGSTGSGSSFDRGGSPREPPFGNNRRGDHYNENNYDPNSGYYDFNSRGGSRERRRQAPPIRPVHSELLRSPYFRMQVKLAQNRVINLHSLQHLASVVLDEDTGRLDRYVMLAFVDSTTSDTDCLFRLSNELLFPYPFAGYSDSHNSNNYGTAYWDDILLSARVAYSKNNPGGLLMARFFGIESIDQCPVFILLERGETLFKNDERNDESIQEYVSKLEREGVYKFVDKEAQKLKFQPKTFSTAEDFQSYMWQRLKVSVSFINRSLWPIDFWWLDGQRGKKLGVLNPGESYSSHTFLSHVFVFRPTIVTGNTLTNESSLLWFTAKIDDNEKAVNIESRCFDLSGECKRWQAEGFCEDPKKRRGPPGPYVRQNPDFSYWVRNNCVVSCNIPCMASSRTRVREKEEYHSPVFSDSPPRSNHEF